MTDTLPTAFTALLAAWNETDLAKIRGHLERALAPDILFADPDNLIHGIDAFEEMVRGFRLAYPDAITAHTSGYNVHHNRYRYHWLVSIGGKPAVPGMDVTHIGNDGLIDRIDGFFGPVPKI